jgi:hypothetical protein
LICCNIERGKRKELKNTKWYKMKKYGGKTEDKRGTKTINPKVIPK